MKKLAFISSSMLIISAGVAGANPAEPNNILYDTLWGLNNTGQSICIINSNDPIGSEPIILNSEANPYACLKVVQDSNGNITSYDTSGLADVDMNAPEGWALVTQDDPENPGENMLVDEDVVIMLLDTGIDHSYSAAGSLLGHPDLVDRMWLNEAEAKRDGNGDLILVDGKPICDRDGEDTDGNGFVDDCYGVNTLVDWLVPNDAPGIGSPEKPCSDYVYDSTTWPVPSGAVDYLGSETSYCKLNPEGGNPVDGHEFHHGTNMAGHMIAPLTEAGDDPGGVVGLAGVAKNVKIMTCASAGFQVSSTLPINLPWVERKNALECVSYALAMKNAGVNLIAINTSGGTSDFITVYLAEDVPFLWGVVFPEYLLDLPEVDAGFAALNDAGILVVASSGNFENDIEQPGFEYYPAASPSPNVISVGAIDHHGNASEFAAYNGSNYGRYSVDVFAPGSNTVSSKHGGGYTISEGTSQSAAYISSLVGMIKAYKPTSNYSAAQIRRLIMSSGKSFASLNDLSVTGMLPRLADSNGEGALTCSNQILRRRQMPNRTDFFLAAGEQIDFEVISYNCADSTGETNLTVTVNAGGSSVSSFDLYDDGSNGDTVADDGIYSGSWVVEAGYSDYELSFGIDTVTGQPDIVHVKTEQVHDNIDSHSKTYWSWFSSSVGSGYYGSNYYYASTVSTRSLTWKPMLDDAGEYELYGRWPQRDNISVATNAQFVVKDADAVDHVLSMDQTQNRGEWVLLGSYSFNAGEQAITIRNGDGNGNVIANGNIYADAIRLVKVGGSE